MDLWIKLTIPEKDYVAMHFQREGQPALDVIEVQISDALMDLMYRFLPDNPQVRIRGRSAIAEIVLKLYAKLTNFVDFERRPTATIQNLLTDIVLWQQRKGCPPLLDALVKDAVREAQFEAEDALKYAPPELPDYQAAIEALYPDAEPAR